MEYLPVLVMMAAGIAIGGAVLLITSLIGPNLPNRMKDSPAECGVPIAEGAQKRVSVRFYLVAILFLLFDVETVFFYPYAVVFKKSLATGSVYIIGSMLAFVAVLLVGYVYIIRKGALDWE
jgi:NADH-quinone oxidoreductase subunit A